MKPDSFRFGGGGETYLHPVFACALVFVAILIFFLPRKYVVVPLLMAAILIPMDEIVVVAGLHFQVARVLILLGWIRLLWTIFSSKVQLFSGGVNAIDKALTLSVIFGALNVILLWQSSAAFINQMGAVYTVLGAYFLLRILIRDDEDIERAGRVFAYILAVVAVLMLIEHATGRNPYVIFGGAGAKIRSMLMERGDRFRAMASFTHPIQAGTFGAILFPLFVGMWWKNSGNRRSAILGMIASTLVMFESVSSTPLMAYLAGILALCLWPLRNQMRIVRLGTVATLVSLHMVMKAPVWALIQRVDLIGGSSGYHRFALVDECIRHFGDWWLLGTKDYMSWGLETWDVSNQYVSLCEGSGLLPFVFFVSILVYGFKYLGNARKVSGEDERSQLFLWALGATLFSNSIAFIGISYSLQTMWAWYALLAMIPVACRASLIVMCPEPRTQIVTEPANMRFADSVVSTPGSIGIDLLDSSKIQPPKSANRLETSGKIAWTGKSKKEAGVKIVDLPETARLQTRDRLSSEGSPEQLQLGKAMSPRTTPPWQGKRTDKWISLILELTSQGVIADHQEERQSDSLRPSTFPRPAPADLPAAPLAPIPGPIPASDAGTREKPVEKSTFAESPTSKSTEQQDRHSADAKPKIALPVPTVDMSADVDANRRKKSPELTVAPDTLLAKPSQPNAIVSNRSEKSQAAYPVRTMQGSASSASLSEELLTKARALLGIKRAAPSEPASADTTSILKPTHETPTEIKSTYNTALPEPLPARESHPAPATNMARELHSTEIPESTASVPNKTVDSLRAEPRPRVASWLVARRLQVRSSIGVAVLCLILAFACIGLGIAIGRRTPKRSPNIASANGDVSREGSTAVATTKGETLTSKPIASPDSAANNRIGSAVERITHGRTSPAIRAAPWTFSIKISNSPSPTPVDALSATTRSDGENSTVAPVASSANSNNVAIPVIPPTSPTSSPDSRETVPLARDTTLRAQQSPDRVMPPHLIYRVEPFYPKEALQQRVEGTVKIHVTVGEDGRVKDLRVLSGPASLTSAALDAATYWRYTPALRNGEPVEMEEDVSVEFHLLH